MLFQHAFNFSPGLLRRCALIERVSRVHCIWRKNFFFFFRFTIENSNIYLFTSVTILFRNYILFCSTPFELGEEEIVHSHYRHFAKRASYMILHFRNESLLLLFSFYHSDATGNGYRERRRREFTFAISYIMQWNTRGGERIEGQKIEIIHQHF
jgi:hypothetical protein